MAKLSYKVSYYLLYVFFALTIIVLGVFYSGEWPVIGEYKTPENTELLIYFMYAMLGICIAVTLIGAVAQFLSALRDNPKGAIKSLIGLLLFVAVLVVTYGMASDASLPLADGTTYTDKSWLKITDMLIYSTYVLFGIAALATLFNLSGIMKK